MKTSKSPKRILQTALAVARQALPAYSHRFSPKKFTQHQLFACLVLKEFLKRDYRGLTAVLADCGELRQTIGLRQVPHFTTFQKAADRLLRAQPARRLLDASVAQARDGSAPAGKLLSRRVRLAAIDSSGFEARHTSRYFARRRRKRSADGKSQEKREKVSYRRFPKLTLVGDARSHLILAAKASQGPRPDFGEFVGPVAAAVGRVPVESLAADAGFDAEWIHQWSREELGVRTLIPPTHGRPPEDNKPPGGYWRRIMHRCLSQSRYGQRWQVETINSMLKRLLGEVVHAKTYWRRCRGLMLKVLTHNILILRLIELFYRAISTAFLFPDALSTPKRFDIRGVGRKESGDESPHSKAIQSPSHRRSLRGRRPGLPRGSCSTARRRARG